MKAIAKLLMTFTLLSALAIADSSDLHYTKADGEKFIYLQGRKEPILLHKDVYVEKAYYASDLNTIIFMLNETSDEGRSIYYFALLVAKRKQKGSAWEIYYTMHASDLYLTYGRYAWIEGVGYVNSYPEVSLDVGYQEYRLAPSQTIRESRVWNILNSQPLKPVEIDPKKLDLDTANPWKNMTVEKYRNRMGDTDYSDEQIASMIKTFGR